MQAELIYKALLAAIRNRHWTVARAYIDLLERIG